MKAIQRKALTAAWMVLAAAMLMLPTYSFAEPKTAHEVAEDVKNQMIDIINNREKYEAQGNGEYLHAVVALFEPVVDFNFIARGVMDKYAKTASDEQKKRFAEVLKTSLMSTVATYTQGLGGTSSFNISVVPPKDGDTKKNPVSVGLEVKTADSVNRLAFTMQNKNDLWKIANMTLNGINLGVTFRAQFDQAVKKAQGNIDAAIDSWSA